MNKLKEFFKAIKELWKDNKTDVFLVVLGMTFMMSALFTDDTYWLLLGLIFLNSGCFGLTMSMQQKKIDTLEERIDNAYNILEIQASINNNTYKQIMNLGGKKFGKSN